MTGEPPRGLGGWAWYCCPLSMRTFSWYCRELCCLYMELGRLHCCQRGAQVASGDLIWVFWVLRQIRFFPSLLPALKSCVISFNVLPGPSVSRSCFHPGESAVLPLWLGCPSPGQVSLAAVLAPLPTSFFTSCKRSCRPAVSALGFFD